MHKGRMMKSQLWLKMEVNGQLHAVSIVHSGEETPLDRKPDRHSSHSAHGNDEKNQENSGAI